MFLSLKCTTVNTTLRGDEKSGIGWVRGFPTPGESNTTLIKNKRKFSSYGKEIQKGAVAKSYITNGLLKYD
jgi:hypothetical protein